MTSLNKNANWYNLLSLHDLKTINISISLPIPNSDIVTHLYKLKELHPTL